MRRSHVEAGDGAGVVVAAAADVAVVAAKWDDSRARNFVPVAATTEAEAAADSVVPAIAGGAVVEAGPVAASGLAIDETGAAAGPNATLGPPSSGSVSIAGVGTVAVDSNATVQSLLDSGTRPYPQKRRREKEAL